MTLLPCRLVSVENHDRNHSSGRDHPAHKTNLVVFQWRGKASPAQHSQRLPSRVPETVEHTLVDSVSCVTHGNINTCCDPEQCGSVRNHRLLGFVSRLRKESGPSKDPQNTARFPRLTHDCVGRKGHIQFYV